MRPFAAILLLGLAPAALAADPDASAPATSERSANPSGGVLIGPKLAVLPIPSLIGLGLELRIKDAVGLSVDYAWFPSFRIPNAANADARMEYRDLSATVRWFPWGQRFFLGAAFGSRTFQASATEAITGLLGSVKVTSTYVAPELGWRFVSPSGFFYGIDLGWQLITSSSASFDLPPGMPPQDQQDLVDAANQIGKVGLPILSLLQFGWYF